MKLDRVNIDSTKRLAGKVVGHRHFYKVASSLVVISGAVVILAAGYNLTYAGKIMPGIRINGAYVGGLSRADAIRLANTRAEGYSRGSLTLSHGNKSWQINLNDIKLRYDAPAAADMALQYGRQGGIPRQVWGQIRTLFGKPTNISRYSYDEAKLTPYLINLSDELSTPAVNATLTAGDGVTKMTPASSGQRVDLGLLLKNLHDTLSSTGSATLPVPVYALAPQIGQSDLAPAVDAAARYTNAPITLSYGDFTQVVDPSQIVSWLKVSRIDGGKSVVTYGLANFYPVKGRLNVIIDDEAIKNYAQSLAQNINRPGQNAVLNFAGDKAVIAMPAKDGYELDKDAAVVDIKRALETPSPRQVTLRVKVSKPQINENSLEELGIKEFLAEGVSYFPGSSANRLQNVRVGAARFNGILLKPGETFSFGALLGDVGPAQGYTPSLVIIGNHEERQYGGGLCQVSSTAYRAALLAGLPILQRTNHSFAVSYYTQPFGVPGVDATIYYPEVDMKFLNDTGSHIWIQTVMQGTTLKFHFYGTKKKSGIIRGPYFITGSNDETKPSHTVFYRDVVDLSGKVTKTDEVHTYYRSSLDFPILPEFN